MEKNLLAKNSTKFYILFNAQGNLSELLTMIFEKYVKKQSKSKSFEFLKIQKKKSKKSFKNCFLKKWKLIFKKMKINFQINFNFLIFEKLEMIIFSTTLHSPGSMFCYLFKSYALFRKVYLWRDFSLFFFIDSLLGTKYTHM